MNKKGQAAMEFLMTYGWAILVVLAAIAALAYFGVLSPQKLLPERTTFTAPLPNVDNAVINTDGTIQVAFKNNVGVDITLTLDGNVTPSASTPCTADITVTAELSDAGHTPIVADTTHIPNGEGFLVTWTCAPASAPAAGSKFKADSLYFEYTNVETGQSRKASGSVDGKYS
jgi:hypothetical protein